MRAALFLVCLSLAMGSDVSWTEQDGRFATFLAPPGMVKDFSGQGIDTIQESYSSPNLMFYFDSEANSLPPYMQSKLEKATQAWTQERKIKWDKNIDVEDHIAVVCGFIDQKQYPEKPYYLYFGFAVDEGNFSLHFRFRSLDALNDIEPLLKSMKLKTNKNG